MRRSALVLVAFTWVGSLHAQNPECSVYTLV